MVFKNFNLEFVFNFKHILNKNVKKHLKKINNMYLITKFFVGLIRQQAT